MSEEKNQVQDIILFFQGGAGDVIAASPCIRAARKAYPTDRIIVASTYAILLENNPNIDFLIHLNKEHDVQDFYETYILGKNVRFFKKFFPYDHILDTPSIGCKSLPEFITNLYGFGEFFDNEFPDYYLTEYEKRAANNFITQGQKPIVLLHVYGAVPSEGGIQKMVCGGCAGRGAGPDGTRCQACGGGGMVIIRDKTNSLKDLNPAALEPIIKKYYPHFTFLQIGLEGEPLVPGAIDCLGMPFRDTCALIQHPQVASFVFIESSFAHIAAAFRKKGVVVFQNTSPYFFGYPSAINYFENKECCPLWPCNRPVGALMDFAPGYLNPKTRQRQLWNCKDQKCSKISPDKLLQAFEKSLPDMWWSATSTHNPFVSDIMTVDKKEENTQEPKVGGQADSLEGAYSL